MVKRRSRGGRLEVEGWGDGVTVKQSLWIHCPNENTRVAVSNFFTLRPGFKKLHLHNPFGQSAKTMQNVRLHKKSVSMYMALEWNLSTTVGWIATKLTPNDQSHRDVSLETCCQQDHCFLGARQTFFSCVACYLFQAIYTCALTLKYSQLFSARHPQQHTYVLQMSVCVPIERRSMRSIC